VKVTITNEMERKQRAGGDDVSSCKGESAAVVDGMVQSDPDMEEVLSWKPYTESPLTKPYIIDGHKDSAPLRREEAEVFKGRILIIEGGVGQGKSQLATAIRDEIKAFGVACTVEKEPVDQHALRLFIKFQKLPNEGSVSSEQMERQREAKIKASEMMQFNMMRRRSEAANRISVVMRAGGFGIMDRGPFGDAAFMSTTFSQAGVPSHLQMQYVIEFMQRYIKIGFKGNQVIILRLRAPPEVGLRRWLSRESNTPGNKYTLDYVKSLEEAHDACGHAWGMHFVYDNSRVPEPGSPDYIASVRRLLRCISVKLCQ
jgi:thymidylate kinase